MRHPVSRSLRTPRWRVHRRGARSSGRADAHLEHPVRTRVACVLVAGGLRPGCGWSVPGLRVGLRMATAQVDEGITARVPLDPRRLLGHAPRTPA